MSWTSFIQPAAMLMAGGYDVYDRNNRRRQMERDHKRRQALEEAHYNQRVAAMGQGGGGGSRNTGAAMGALREQNAMAMAMLQPFIDQAQKTMPIMAEGYHQGLEGMMPVMGNILNQDFVNPLTQFKRPAPMELPEFLSGGKRSE
jgi:hypothetical protein